MSWSSKWIDDKLTLETEFAVLGRALSLETGVHWDAKSIEMVNAFSLKTDISLLLTKIRGINGIFFPL